MKNLLIIAGAAFVLLSAFTHKHQAAATAVAKTTTTNPDSLLHFGKKIDTKDALSSGRLPYLLNGHDSLKTKVFGKIESVCQKKGCWMKMDIGGGKTMMVRFKDYAFFAPKDASGSMAYVEGYAYVETTSVAQLRHYAEDAGKSKKEIEAITQPETEITFMADGLAIVKK